MPIVAIPPTKTIAIKIVMGREIDLNFFNIYLTPYSVLKICYTKSNHVFYNQVLKEYFRKKGINLD